MTYRWLRRRGVNAGAAGLAGSLTILLNDVALAIVSLAGLMIVIHLKKSSQCACCQFHPCNVDSWCFARSFDTVPDLSKKIRPHRHRSC
jgi:hypothetical protein